MITYILPGVQSEPPANAVRTGYCKELPPILISVLTRGWNVLQKMHIVTLSSAFWRAQQEEEKDIQQGAFAYHLLHAHQSMKNVQHAHQSPRFHDMEIG